MQMADSNHRQIAELCLRLSKTQKSTAAHVDKNFRLSLDPEQVTG
jgi:hypothetical protein